MNNVYLKAAKRLDDEGEGFACCAIDKEAGDEGFSLARAAFVKLFQPEGEAVDPFALGHPFWEIDEREPRILALLFMHWITQGGDDAPQP